jgi:hypothetical protein
VNDTGATMTPEDSSSGVSEPISAIISSTIASVDDGKNSLNLFPPIIP